VRYRNVSLPAGDSGGSAAGYQFEALICIAWIVKKIVLANGGSSYKFLA
jgi:hypothetical protein